MKGINYLTDELKRGEFKSAIVAEIHDSCVMEVAYDELEVINKLAQECLVDRVEEDYPWMDMPLIIDGDVYIRNWGELDGNVNPKTGEGVKEIMELIESR